MNKLVLVFSIITIILVAGLAYSSSIITTQGNQITNDQEKQAQLLSNLQNVAVHLNYSTSELSKRATYYQNFLFNVSIEVDNFIIFDTITVAGTNVTLKSINLEPRGENTISNQVHPNPYYQNNTLPDLSSWPLLIWNKEGIKIIGVMVATAVSYSFYQLPEGPFFSDTVTFENSLGSSTIQHNVYMINFTGYVGIQYFNASSSVIFTLFDGDYYPSSLEVDLL